MVAAGGRLQGAQSLDEAMELIEFTRTCASLELRGIAAEHADPKVAPGNLCARFAALHFCSPPVLPGMLFSKHR